MIRSIWREMSIEMYIFFRVVVSLCRWDWLAVIIRGSSQVVRISRGVERGSVKNKGEKFRLLLVVW